jgi:hypothetical protein
MFWDKDMVKPSENFFLFLLFSAFLFFFLRSFSLGARFVLARFLDFL